ncbi:uncharacterized protein LOC106668711 [Cimex lectularius]|uniref:Uncharacterized protein n=1 Tax=Cimex lectularius TaxID=79782 RepID=A0A8I6S4C8_CIMLE|nr:uncharacterized protein LOC106668711 [Cimex lectularius]
MAMFSVKDPDIVELDDDAKVPWVHQAFSHPDTRELQKEIARVMKRIQKNPNVISTLFINNWGLPEETTMKIMLATLTSRVFRPFIWRCEHLVRDLDPDDVLVAVRLTTLKSEILMTSDVDFIFVVFHKLLPEPVLYPKAPKNKEY